MTIISFPSWKIFGIPQTEKDLKDFEYSLSKLSKPGSKINFCSTSGSEQFRFLALPVQPLRRPLKQLFTNGADFLVENQISIADIFLGLFQILLSDWFTNKKRYWKLFKLAIYRYQLYYQIMIIQNFRKLRNFILR